VPRRLTPEDVRLKEFRQSFRGYSEVEVDAFLDEVEAELGRLLSENAALREQLSRSAAAPPPQASESEEMLRRTLLLAQQSADETVAAARIEAARLREEAQAVSGKALGDLDARRRALEQQVEGLRAFEREYRARLRAYLEGQLRELDGRGELGPAGPGRAG
jgi:DivIVA domain-containing protein